MDRLVILVDGDYVRAALAWTARGAGSRPEIVLDYQTCLSFVREAAARTVPLELLRTYWSETRSPANARELEAISCAPRVKLVEHTKDGEAPLAGVLMDLGRKQAVADVVVIAGDARLAPAIAEAQSYGVAVHAMTLGEPGVSSSQSIETLRRVADTFTEISSTEVVARLLAPTLSDAAGDAGVPEASRKFLERVVDQVIEDTSDAELEKFLQEHKRGHLPHGIDRALLILAQREIGRELVGREKRFMREMFYDIAHYEMDVDAASEGETGSRAA